MKRERYDKLVQYWIMSDKPLADLQKALETLTLLEYLLFKSKRNGKKWIIIDNSMPKAIDKLGKEALKASLSFERLNYTLNEYTNFDKPRKTYSKYNTHYSRNSK